MGSPRVEVCLIKDFIAFAGAGAGAYGELTSSKVLRPPDQETPQRKSMLGLLHSSMVRVDKLVIYLQGSQSIIPLVGPAAAAEAAAYSGWSSRCHSPQASKKHATSGLTTLVARGFWSIGREQLMLQTESLRSVCCWSHPEVAHALLPSQPAGRSQVCCISWH